MASISREIMQDIAVMRLQFKEAGDYEGVGITHLAEDHADGISKLHQPMVEYIENFTSTLSSIKGMTHTSIHEAEILEEIIGLAHLHLSMYTE